MAVVYFLVKDALHYVWKYLIQNITWPWWRHQMEAFFALLDLCEGNPRFTGGFPSQTPVTRSFDVFFDLCLNKRLSKNSRRRWFETPLHSLWRDDSDVHWAAMGDIFHKICTRFYFGFVWLKMPRGSKWLIYKSTDTSLAGMHPHDYPSYNELAT